MDTLAKRVQQLAKIIGDGCSYLILGIIAIITYEVVARYVFNAPTSWAWLINKQLFGIFALAGGAYALVHDSHIRIEVLYQHFSPAGKRIISWLTFFCAAGFLGALLWKSWAMGNLAWQTKELAMGVFKLPLYPLKMFMPIAALLFLLCCLARLVRNSGRRNSP